MYNGADGNQESTRRSDGEERWDGAGEEAHGEAPQGNSQGRGGSSVGFVYFIETEGGEFVNTGFLVAGGVLTFQNPSS